VAHDKTRDAEETNASANPSAPTKQPLSTRFDLSPLLDAAREIVREEFDAKPDEKLAGFLGELETTLQQSLRIALPSDAEGPRSDGENSFAFHRCWTVGTETLNAVSCSQHRRIPAAGRTGRRAAGGAR
jgi:hypothetical protein